MDIIVYLSTRDKGKNYLPSYGYLVTCMARMLENNLSRDYIANSDSTWITLVFKKLPHHLEVAPLQSEGEFFSLNLSPSWIRIYYISNVLKIAVAGKKPNWLEKLSCFAKDLPHSLKKSSNPYFPVFFE